MTIAQGRGTAAGALAACLACLLVTLTSCGGSSGESPKPAPSRNAAAAHQRPPGPSPAMSAPSRNLAVLRGDSGMEVDITSAVRDSGGFVTVQGTIRNNGASAFNAVDWRGQETAVESSGPSVAGAVLIDEKGLKRYYVLRDTEGKCLCTMGLVGIEPQQSVPFFAQFPAPPASTTQVDFELPDLPPATISLSGG